MPTRLRATRKSPATCSSRATHGFAAAISCGATPWAISTSSTGSAILSAGRVKTSRLPRWRKSSRLSGRPRDDRLRRGSARRRRPRRNGRHRAMGLRGARSYGLARLSEAALPAYARPIFLRMRKRLDTTGTFKQRKIELVAEGFDLTRSPDRCISRIVRKAPSFPSTRRSASVSFRATSIYEARLPAANLATPHPRRKECSLRNICARHGVCGTPRGPATGRALFRTRTSIASVAPARGGRQGMRDEFPFWLGGSDLSTAPRRVYRSIARPNLRLAPPAQTVSALAERSHSVSKSKRSTLGRRAAMSPIGTI